MLWTIQGCAIATHPMNATVAHARYQRAPCTGCILTCAPPAGVLATPFPVCIFDVLEPSLAAHDFLRHPQVSVATEKIFAGSKGFSFVVGDEASLVRCHSQGVHVVRMRVSISSVLLRTCAENMYMLGPSSGDSAGRCEAKAAASASLSHLHSDLWAF